jgi:hypothetical protein
MGNNLITEQAQTSGTELKHGDALVLVFPTALMHIPVAILELRRKGFTVDDKIVSLIVTEQTAGLLAKLERFVRRAYFGDPIRLLGYIDIGYAVFPPTASLDSKVWKAICNNPRHADWVQDRKDNAASVAQWLVGNAVHGIVVRNVPVKRPSPDQPSLTKAVYGDKSLGSLQSTYGAGNVLSFFVLYNDRDEETIILRDLNVVPSPVRLE